MNRYTTAPRVGWTWEPIPAQRFRPFSTVPEKLVLMACSMGLMLLIVIMGK